MRNLLFLSLFSTALAVAAAPAPVTELGRQHNSPGSDGGYGSTPAATPTQAADSYSRLQILEDEVRQLRGMLEEQQHELRQLKKRQSEDYLDLDSRLSGGGSGTGGPVLTDDSSGAGADSDGAASDTVNTDVADSRASSGRSAPNEAGSRVDSAEQKAYDAAYELVKERQIDKAVSAFKGHIGNYPGGQHVPNSYYWLGEIYLLKSQYGDASKAFSAVVDKYPEHRKAPDAAFKLGKVYHLQGEKAKAKSILTGVAAGNSSAARLAQAYLKENF